MKRSIRAEIAGEFQAAHNKGKSIGQSHPLGSYHLADNIWVIWGRPSDPLADWLAMAEYKGFDEGQKQRAAEVKAYIERTDDPAPLNPTEAPPTPPGRDIRTPRRARGVIQ